MKYHEKLRFLNKSYFNKIYVVLVLLQTDFWCVDKNSGKPKFLDGDGQKWPWSLRSRDSKICCILRMNQSIELIFHMPIQI